MPDHHRTVADALSATGPTGPWAESATTDRRVDRTELVALAEAWRPVPLRGRRVALLEPDPVAFAALYVALLANGATVVPLDPVAPADAQRAHLATTRTRLVVTTEPAIVPDGTPVLAADRGRLHPGTDRAPASTVVDLPRLAEDADGAGCLLLSSGSTGPRKAIRLAEAQLLHVARTVAHTHRLGPDDRAYNPLPLFHVNGEVVGLLAPLLSGGAVVLADRFHRTGFWERVRERRVTWVNAVPGILAILAQDAGREGPPPGVRFVRSASAPLPRAVLERFETRFGLPVVESYGMTEAASQITVNPLDDRRPGTVGRPAGVELRVVDEAGRAVGAGVVGRVGIRGPGVVRAYDGGVGADRFDTEGWLDTGDLGVLDRDGYLTLAGRDADVINRGGEKVFPREVEEVLAAHPGVRETVVVARPDPVLGEVPVAYVVPAPGAPGVPDGLEDELTARCAAALPRAHRPVEIRLVEELQRGPTGKPLRRLQPAADPA